YQIIKKGDSIEKIVFMLHGFGSNMHDLPSIIPELSLYLENTAFISVNAPFICEDAASDTQRQWFSLKDRSYDAMKKGADIASLKFQEFGQNIINQMSLTWQNVALLGFSQGAMLSLHIAFDILPCAALCYSGLLIDLPEHAKAIKTKIALIHGKEDEIVPIQYMNVALKKLQSYKIDVENHAMQRLGHGIDAKGIEIGGTFLKNAFKKN
ncbi:MAG: dienelactone hydrolase family protein, partial [Proteobacteria bacterium]|nr:dienelactone hydrolase family protein [Pseudomonadota bacterium]